MERGGEYGGVAAGAGGPAAGGRRGGAGGGTTAAAAAAEEGRGKGGELVVEECEVKRVAPGGREVGRGGLKRAETRWVRCQG